MEQPIEAYLVLHIETSKGYVLDRRFGTYAELFEFMCERILGDSAFDGLAGLVTTLPGQTRGENYKHDETERIWMFDPSVRAKYQEMLKTGTVPMWDARTGERFTAPPEKE